MPANLPARSVSSSMYACRHGPVHSDSWLAHSPINRSSSRFSSAVSSGVNTWATRR